MFRKLGVLLLFLFLGQSALAQTWTHTKLIYENTLLQDSEDDFAKVINKNGLYNVKGWKSYSEKGKLIIQFKDRLPQIGTIQFKVTNFDPVNRVYDNSHTFCLLSSSWDNPLDLNGNESWINIRTSKDYVTPPNKCYFKVDVSPNGHDMQEQRYTPENQEWLYGREYHIKILFDYDHAVVYIDDVQVSENHFDGQTQRFKYLFLGGDYKNTNIQDLEFSNLKVFTMEPEQNVFFMDKTWSRNLLGLGAPDFSGHGLAVGDVNGDGLKDIYIGNCMQGGCRRDVLYIQQPDGTFVDETELRGVADECCSHAVIFFDADNDGDLDLFNANTWQPNQLYINDGAGYFSEESFARGIENIDGETRGAVVFDVNNDGWLDIFAVNWGMKNEMYINDGTGHFVREYRGAEGAVENPEVVGTQGVTVADIENDGDYDIYISKRDKDNELYINENGFFTEAAHERNIDVPKRTDGATFADYDNDGDMDLFVNNTRQSGQKGLKLYIFVNDGSGYFIDRTADYDLLMDGFTTQLMDIDNDGDLDLYRLINNDYQRTVGGRLDLNDGAGNFISTGFSGPNAIGADARGCIVTDLDQDGDLDFYISCKLFENLYLENLTENNNNFLEITAIGPAGDFGGVGSKVDIYEAGRMGDRNYLLGHREVTTVVGYLSSRDLAQHFGLGVRAVCDVRVTYVNGAIVERANVAANQRLIIAAPQHINTLHYVSGNGQSGLINQSLASPFVVRLLTDEGLPASNENVQFVVVQGDGSFQAGETVSTDANGYASNLLSFGAQAGTVVAEARVSGATDSPVQFTATAQAAALRLLKISGDSQSGVVGAVLPQQLVVQTLYENGGNAANVSVQFQASTDGLVNGLASTSIQSDAQGFAAVVWTLGVTAGRQTVTVEIAGESVVFAANASAAAAHALQKLGGDQLLNPGVAFAQPFQVKVVDEYGNGVSEQNVRYQVTAGAGTISGAVQVNVGTDQNGVAGVIWTPDPYLGPDNRLQASATMNGQPLANSPAVWDYPGIAVDPTASTVTATSPVPADGVAKSDIVVTLRTSQSQTVGAGLTVALDISGSDNQLDMPTNKTDANGRVYAALSSLIGETKTVTARVLGLNLQLAQQPAVEFLTMHTEAVKIIKDSGDGQSAVVARTLPLTVKVLDAKNRPVPNHNVSFIRISGEGSFSGSAVSTLATIEDGSATAIYTFGETAYVHSIIEARAESIAETVRFTVSSVPGEPRKLIIVSGNNQQGAPHTAAPQPLMVRVRDLYDNNIAIAPVQFKVNIGDALVNGAAQTTVFSDSLGLAFVSASFGERAQSIIEAKAGAVSVSFTLLSSGEIPDPDLALSQVSATSPIAADGYSTSHVVATIYDAYGRPLSGVAVRIAATGESLNLVQTDSLTNAAGQARAELSSTMSGEKTVMAYIMPQNTLVEQVAAVTFEAITVEMALVSGQDQTGVVGKPCPEPLVVRLQHNGNPVVEQYVKFSVMSGGGHFNGQSELVVQSDQAGLALAEYFLGTRAGDNIVSATALISPDAAVQFHLKSRADKATTLAKSDGDNQTGATLSPLGQPLAALVSDLYGNPAIGDVTFTAIDGGFVTTPQPTAPDSLGRVHALVKLGERVGRYTFKAELANGEFVLFTATSVRLNNPPEIISFVPYETALKFGYGDRLHFEIMNVFDRDGDVLHYHWRLNGRSVGMETALDLFMSQGFPALNAVNCAVSDGVDSATVQWTLTWDPASRVDLGAFQAEVVKGKGVRLTWSIKSQQDNAGFHVLRSNSKNRPFAAVTPELITAQNSINGEYAFIDEEAQQPGLYFYKLESVSKSGRTQQFEAISVTVQAPEQLALLQNYPNPFNPTTAISFELPEAAYVNLAIYNQKGQMVQRLVSGERPMGLHTVIWDAADEQGRHVPSGIYFYVLSVDGQSITRKLTLLK